MSGARCNRTGSRTRRPARPPICNAGTWRRHPRWRQIALQWLACFEHHVPPKGYFFCWLFLVGLLHAVQGEIEDIEIAQGPGFSEIPVGFVVGVREHERHDRLAQPAMGSKTMAIEACKVMLGPA